MLEVILYKNFRDIKKSNLSGRIVTPNPRISDAVYKYYAATSEVQDVTTISHALKDIVRRNDLFDWDTRYTSKSKLLLKLALAWYQKYQTSYADFNNIFILATELRSITLNNEVLLSIIEPLDEDVQEKVVFISNIITALDFIDEPLSYQTLKGLHDLKDEWSLIGFQYLSAIQTDFLFSLGDDFKVRLFLPKFVYENASELSWVGWLRTNTEKRITEIKSESPLGNKQEKTCYYFDEIKDVSIDMKVLESTNMKVSGDIYTIEVRALKNQLVKDHHGLKQSQFEIVLSELTSRFVKGEKWHQLKIIELLKESLDEWKKLTSEDVVLNNFMFDVLFKVISLNLPRTYMLSANSKNYIEQADIISFFNPRCNNIYATDNESVYGGGRTVIDSYGLTSKVAMIAPVKDSSLVKLFKEHSLEDFQSCEGNLVVNPSDLQEPTKENRNISYKQPLGPVAKYLNREFISPTEIQNYIDCPRKYYLTNIEKIMPRVELHKMVDKRLLGVWAHELIESVYLKKVFKEEAIAVEIKRYILENKLTCSKFNFEYLFFKLLSMIKPVLQRLASIPELVFEKEIYSDDIVSSVKVRGRVDFTGDFEDFTVIADFKSNGAPATSREIFNFEYNQLWIYQYMARSRKPILLIYYNLQSIDESLVFHVGGDVTGSEYYEVLTRGIKINKVSNEKEHRENLEKFLIKTISQVISDKQCLAKPRKATICDYCSVKEICSRGRM